jgi:membrane protease YdiL (CAAX protease family)
LSTPAAEVPVEPEAAPAVAPRPDSKARGWAEVLALYLGSCLVIRGIKALVDGGTLADDWLVLVALVFLYTPAIAERWTGFRVDPQVQFPEPFGPALRRAALWWLGLVLLIYPVFVVGYHVLQTWGFHWFTDEILGMRHPYPRFAPRHPITGGIAATIVLQVLYQLLCVGYAEEYFYRGYMQTRLDTLLRPDRFGVFGARFGWGLLLGALLFTVGHSIVTWQWWQPFILFPALAFAWLRARTGNVLAGALFHAWANSVMIVLDHIYGITVLEPTTGRDLVQDVLDVARDLGRLFGMGG